MVEHYSRKIQNVIQKELFKAHKSIKIAVAWFTNDLLFQPLLMKLDAGVKVELILNFDETNVSDNKDIDFNTFIDKGGVLRWNKTRQLLHDKFCIIDERVVISGSYNWTNRAEYNNENISVFYDETETTSFFLKKFGDLSKKYSQEPIPIRAKPIVQDNSIITNVSPMVRLVGVKDEYGVLYSADGSILIKGTNSTSYIVKDGTRIIADNAFEECIELMSIILPETVVAIGTRAFNRCCNLRNISIPLSVSRICSQAFMFCSSLASIHIPNNQALLGEGVFSGCSKLKMVTLPQYMTKIPKELFLNCSQLESLSIPETVTEFGERSFFGCRSLENIPISENIKSLGDQCFLSCKRYKKIIIPSSITHIGKNVFAGIDEPDITCHSAKYIISDYTLYSHDYKMLISTWKVCDQYVVRPEVRTIGAYAFENGQYGNIYIPDTVISIEEYAFAYCRELESIRLPNGISTITNSLFEGCIKLRSVIIPDSVMTIEGWAFNGCEGVDEFILPSGLCKLGRCAFQMCHVDKIFLPDSLLKVELNPFGIRHVDVLVNKGQKDRMEKVLLSAYKVKTWGANGWVDKIEYNDISIIEI